jgi:GT2 family glycosyltransferase
VNAENCPEISIVIVCHNDGKWLPGCVKSLRQQTIYDRTELLIVDNASNDGTDEIARTLLREWKCGRFIPTGGDNGFAFACNRGAEAAAGRFIYLLSPDTWLEPDCLEQFLKAVYQHKANGAGCTILEYENNSLQARGSNGFDIFGSPVSPRKNEVPNPLFCIAGFAFVERDAFMRIGMLDEKLFMYGEELDMAWRLWVCGYALVPAPAANVHHRGAALVNPAGGTKVIENRTSVQKRFLANRNSLLIIARNAQSILLCLLLPCSLLILIEFLATLALTRNWRVAKAACLDPFASAWKLRHHVLARRRDLAVRRKHGDFWMLRFFRFGFGRWGEIEKVFRLGLPRID